MTGVSVAFGFDFGTSKSAISWARADSINPIVIDISLDGQADRIDTCLLYDKAKGRSFIGTKAHEQFRLSLLNGNAERMEFFANFKPHIGESARDREAALRFLKEIRRSEGLVRELEHIPLKDAVFVVGCPVSWIGDGASELIDLLKDAGFPPSFAIPEPVGAAFYFLGSKLRAQAFHKDIVVCDWGAGTFDMTVLRSSRLSYENSESWGSKLYGGRLFDDLFYQWVLETAAQRGHGNAVRRLAALPVEQEIFHASKARKIKEDFSRFCARDEKPQSWIWESPVVIGVGSDRIDLGDFVVDRISDFELRMRNYSASKLAKRWIDLAEYDAESAEADYVEALKTGKPVDLRAWGAALFEAGLQKLAVGEGATIILTGGSSNWRWFSDHVNSKWPFAGRPSSVIFDSKPELTIARGLARVYAVGSYSGRLAQEIEAARSELSAPLRAIHAELLEKLADKLTIIMRSDRKLQAELEAIFKSWIAGDSQRGQYSSSGERLRRFSRTWLKTSRWRKFARGSNGASAIGSRKIRGK
jgi:molecular chaperone DnaK